MDHPHEIKEREMTWQAKKYLAIAIDPIHVGVGGERLGRVDLPVAREPVTCVPKIPGTALSGAMKYFIDRGLREFRVKENTCASSRGSDKNNSHDLKTCPICSVFGFTGEENTQSSGKSTISLKGILQFGDALLVAFPATSYLGPVWVTTQERLFSVLGIKSSLTDVGDGFTLPHDSEFSNKIMDNALNLGWIALCRSDENTDISVQDCIKACIPESISRRIVIVSDMIFSNLSNDNLELRTSVVIDPDTGAAKGKGLFTFEAVPRGSVFCFDITVNDHFDGWSAVSWPVVEPKRPEDPLALVEQYAFQGIEAVGLGGMTTRGFGRMHIQSVLTGTRE